MRPEETRDQAVERLLRRSFEIGGRAEVSPNCLDAETLAAWTDGTLDAFQLNTVEAHLADCTRCQAMAAVMTRVTPSAPVEMPWWRRSLRSSWLVPLTAGAAAVLLWAIVPNVPGDVAQQTTAVAEPSVERPSVESKAPSQPAMADRVEGGADARTKAPTAGGASSSTSVRANRPRFDVAAANSKPVDEKRENETSRANPRRAAAEETADRLAAVAPPTPPPPTAPVPATPSATASAASPAPAAAAQPRPASAAPDASRFREGAGGALLKQQAVTREIQSPIAATKWRVGAGGLIERTDDGGTTWRRLASGVTADLTAGAAPSPSFCWVVGRNSTVLRSTDGVTWVRVNVPEAADLVGVEATDALTAIVSAADGRKFRTSDGGQTWIK